MERWLVELSGDRYYIDDFPYFFPDGEVRSVAEDDRVYLVASSFESLIEPAQVHELANQFVDELSAVLSVHLGHFVRPKLGVIYREDAEGNRTGHHVLQAEGAIVHSKVRALLGPTVGPTTPQHFLSAAAASSHLRTAMLIWSDPTRTWARLYRVMEENHAHNVVRTSILVR